MKTGLVVGKMAALVHLVWSVFVALGWAASIINFSMWAHRVTVPVTVHAFDLSAALAVIVVAFVVGYVVGHVFAVIWNWVHR